MTDYPDLCNNEPSCQKPELLRRVRELEEKIWTALQVLDRTANLMPPKVAIQLYEALADD